MCQYGKHEKAHRHTGINIHTHNHRQRHREGYGWDYETGSISLVMWKSLHKLGRP